MDNHFVPNLTFGPLIVAAVRKLTTRVRGRAPDDRRARAASCPSSARPAPTQITVHLEACADLGRHAGDACRRPGATVGLALKPGDAAGARPSATSADLDLLLVMTVEPGFGGQAFMADMLEKVRAAAAWRAAHGARYLIEVDGGIAPDTARRCRAAGADVFVAGHSVFRQPDPGRRWRRCRKAIR